MGRFINPGPRTVEIPKKFQKNPGPRTPQQGPRPLPKEYTEDPGQEALTKSLEKSLGKK